MKKTEEFCEGSRYIYDNTLLKKGFAQVDTGQDASYFGVWASPKHRIIFTFAEGDCITQQAETDQEFISEMRNIKQWNVDNGYSCNIDCGYDEDVRYRFKNLGLTDLLHKSQRN